jgi:hypothetical protein
MDNQSNKRWKRNKSRNKMWEVCDGIKDQLVFWWDMAL